MGLVVNSSNVNVFDYEVEYNLDTQEITLTNATTYQGGGAAATSGINFLLTAPDGTEYSDNTSFGTSADIKPATPTVPYVADMPSFLGQVITGNWTAKGIIKDGGVEYPLTKILNICKVASCDAQKNTSNGCAVISFTANCVSNQLVYQDRTTYNYKGVDASDVLYSVTMQYPLASGKATITDADVAYFVDSPAYSGLYQFDIENTATYDFSDSQSVVIVYKLVFTKEIYCQVSLCDLKCNYASYIEAYIDEKNNNASSQKARTMQENLLLLNSYMLEAELGLACGDDISDLIAKIEAISGKVCNCCGNGNTVVGVNTLQNIVMQDACGTTITETTVGSTTTFVVSSKTFVVDTNSEGVTISVEEDGCTATYFVDVCLENLSVCTSVFPIADGNGGSTNVASTYTAIVAAQNTTVNVVNTRLNALVAQDVVLQNEITALAVESWKTFGGGGTFVNGQSVPALNSAINPAANTSWVLAGTTIFKDTDIGQNLRARYNPQTNCIDINGAVTTTAAVVNALITTMPTGYIPTREQIIGSVSMQVTAANNAVPSTATLFVYVRSNGQIRMAMNSTPDGSFSYVICYINGSYALN